jgi:hypothetical protein
MTKQTTTKRELIDARSAEMINDGLGYVPREAAIMDHPAVAELHRRLGIAPGATR